MHMFPISTVGAVAVVEVGEIATHFNGSCSMVEKARPRPAPLLRHSHTPTGRAAVVAASCGRRFCRASNRSSPPQLPQSILSQG
jgi:hypothetical protein